MFRLFVISISLSLFTLSSQAFSATYPLAPLIQKGSSMEFKEHNSDGYLAMNLPFKPMSELFEKFQAQISRPLTNRGEAHITVITPVEYSEQLKPFGVTINKINEIAESMKIQKSSFQIICLGRGQAHVKNQQEETYFVVVQSEDLLKIRLKIQEVLSKSKNGGKSKFNADNYYPHITLGFTKRDLFESDGVIKNNDSCIAELNLNP